MLAWSTWRPWRSWRSALVASSLEELRESGLGVVLDVRLGGVVVGGSGRTAEDGVEARDGLHDVVEIEASLHRLLGLRVDDGRVEGEHGGEVLGGRGWWRG